MAWLRTLKHELVVDQDPAAIVDDQELDPGRDDLLAISGQHFPMKSNHIA